MRAGQRPRTSGASETRGASARASVRAFGDTKPVALRIERGVHAVAHLQLAVDLDHPPAHGSLAEVQRSGDVPVRFPVGDERQDLALDGVERTQATSARTQGPSREGRRDYQEVTEDQPEDLHE